MTQNVVWAVGILIGFVDPKDKSFSMGILETFFAVFGLFDLFIII